MGEMKRFLGIDYGTKRIGIAISDPMGILARGLETITWRNDLTKPIQRIGKLLIRTKLASLLSVSRVGPMAGSEIWKSKAGRLPRRSRRN